MALNVTWKDSGREPQCPADPAYPNGKDVDVSGGGDFCMIDLLYPAPRCGLWLVRCDRCGKSVAITAAGRPDDPRSVKLACRAKAEGVGPTGDFPEGKLSPDDEGELALAIGAWEGKIKIMFGKEVAWLALTPQQALAVAAALKSYAEDMLVASAADDARH